MLYDIGLKIAYEYTNLAAAGRHCLRLLPADLPGEQRLIAGRLNISPTPDERIEKTDFFQNMMTDVAYRTEYRNITFSIQARVERTMGFPSFDISPRLDVSGQRDRRDQVGGPFISSAFSWQLAQN